MDGCISMSNKELSRLETMQRLHCKSLTQAEASEILGVSIRQIKRLWKAYKAEGPKGLISKKRGAIGNHRLSIAVKESALVLILEKYSDFGPTLAHEKLTEIHHLQISVGSVRNLMISHSIWESKKIKRKRVFQLRERRSREGEMVQADGSEHAWFEDRGPRCTLLVFIDDATSRLKTLRFVKAETVFDYYDATREYLHAHGRPLVLYSDKHVVFRVNKEGSLSGTGLTQFGRAMEELGIKIIYANSPQAKGRVERSNRILQDRLVKELRLRNISTIEEANAFLPTFIEDYNHRFAVIPKSSANAHRPLLQTHDLDQIFTIQQTRHLSKNLTLQYKNVTYQIISDKQSYVLRGMKVMVCENREGQIRILNKSKEMRYATYHVQQKQGETVESKLINSEWEKITQEPTKKKHKPNQYHPWKRWVPKAKVAAL